MGLQPGPPARYDRPAEGAYNTREGPRRSQARTARGLAVPAFPAHGLLSRIKRATIAPMVDTVTEGRKRQIARLSVNELLNIGHKLIQPERLW
jgi:hypothetical protein